MTAWNLTPDRPANTREERKMRKPLIERKRRERINHCLDQLRETVVCAFRLDQSKLEKADILEMTVKHLQNIQSNKSEEPFLDPEAQQRYSTGYIQCMHEVHNLLLSCDWMDKTLGARLLNHLLRSLPKSAPEGPRQPEPSIANHSHSEAAQFHNAEPHGSPSCPSSPARMVQPTEIPSSRPPSSESPTLHALEMWRPW